MKYLTTVGDKTFTIEINDDRHIVVDGKTYVVDLEAMSSQSLYSLLLDSHSFESFIDEAEEGWRVLLRGDLYDVKVVDERAARLAKSAGGVAAHSGELDNVRDETQTAIAAVLNGERWVDLPPGPSLVRRLQHEMARTAELVSHSYGKEPRRHVRIFRE